MKLVKLSLAAAIAAGALATSASAVAFEEAIKDVDLSGMAFVRYQNAKRDGVIADGNWWKFKSVLTLKTKIDDNFFMLAGFQYGADKDVGSSGDLARDNNGRITKYNTGFDTEGFRVTQALLGYNIGGTTVMVGRYTLGTFFTDDMLGNGIKVVNTDVQGLTLAALWADALENDGDVLDGKSGAYREAIRTKMGRDVLSHNLYGVAAIGSYDPLSFQIWYASLQDVANLFAIEAGLNFGITDDVSLGITGQYAFADVDSDIKDTVGDVEDSKFAAGQASLGAFGFDLNAGYVYYKAKDNKVSLSSLDDNGQFISAGQVLVPDSGYSSYHAYRGKNDYWFITAGYKIPNTGVSFGVDYVKGKFTEVGKPGNNVNPERIQAEEIVGRIGYKYNKKLNFTSWYSHINYKPETMVDDRTFRIQAQYKF